MDEHELPGTKIKWANRNLLEIELFGGSSLQAKYQWLNKIAYQIGLKPKETFQSHTPS
jgi:hypothetical protein